MTEGQQRFHYFLKFLGVSEMSLQCTAKAQRLRQAHRVSIFLSYFSYSIGMTRSLLRISQLPHQPDGEHLATHSQIFAIQLCQQAMLLGLVKREHLFHR
jgi:hypothetical protein